MQGWIPDQVRNDTMRKVISVTDFESDGIRPQQMGTLRT
jgi:hypothetical protein